MEQQAIPTYQLYGESGQFPLDPMHCESIAARSSLHNWKIQPHRHAQLLHLFLLRGGRTVLSLDGQEQAVPAPSILIIPARTVHGFIFSRDIDGLVLTMNESILSEGFSIPPEMRALLTQTRILPIARKADCDKVAQLFESLAEEFTHTGAARLLALKAHLGLILVWIVRAIEAATRTALGASDRPARHLAEFQALIESHYREGVNLDFYASKLGITPTQLNNICRERLGKSAKRAVHDRIFLEARRSLIYTVMSVNEVAMMLGFNDPAYFTRFFTRLAGMSPTAFRQRATKGVRPPARAKTSARAQSSSRRAPRGPIKKTKIAAITKGMPSTV
ncbi:MAG: helix-turn-helix domain-containing protein [Sphingomonadales bacterium]